MNLSICFSLFPSPFSPSSLFFFKSLLFLFCCCCVYVFVSSTLWYCLCILSIHTFFSYMNSIYGMYNSIIVFLFHLRLFHIITLIVQIQYLSLYISVIRCYLSYENLYYYYCYYSI